MRARARKRRSGSRHAHLGPCARARKRPAVGSHPIAPAGPEHKGNAGNQVLEAIFRSMVVCSCSQTAARRSRDSALCAAPHVLVLAKKVRENADVLALASSLLLSLACKYPCHRWILNRYRIQHVVPNSSWRTHIPAGCCTKHYLYYIMLTPMIRTPPR